MPKVSIVMPAYNVSRFVAGAISSVLDQTFTDFELLIVNDGSTDDTLAICRRFTDRRIRIVDQHNRGLAGARNSGIRESRGEFLAFIDSDDLWRADKLERHVAHLDANKTVGVSYSVSQFMSEDGERLSLYQNPKLNGVTSDDVLCRNPVGNGSAPVIRRATLKDIERTDDRYGDPEPVYFDPDFRQSEDIECWTRIAATTPWRFAGLPEPLTLYRLNAGGLSACVEKQLASWEAFFAKAERYAPTLTKRSGSLARAYQYRYLARRALWSGESRLAASLVGRALRSDWRMLMHEPRRTLSTLMATALQLCLPIPLYRWVERTALALR